MGDTGTTQDSRGQILALVVRKNDDRKHGPKTNTQKRLVPFHFSLSVFFAHFLSPLHCNCDQLHFRPCPRKLDGHPASGQSLGVPSLRSLITLRLMSTEDQLLSVPWSSLPRSPGALARPGARPVPLPELRPPQGQTPGVAL